MVGWHRQLDEHEFEQAPGVDDGQSIQPVFVFWLGAFNPITFKVIIDKYDPIAIYFIVLGSCLYSLSVFPV